MLEKGTKDTIEYMKELNKRPRGRQRKLSNPARVAKIVKEKMANGERIVMSEILRSVGYSATMQKNPRQVTETGPYKKEMGDFADRLELHREKILQAMDKKDLHQEQYRTLTDALPKVNHDIQLLKGKPTENIAADNDRNTLLAIISEIRGLDAPTPVPHTEIETLSLEADEPSTDI